MAGRRGWGEDSIYFDHSGECRDPETHRHCPGRWRGVVSLKPGPDGQRRRKKVELLAKAPDPAAAAKLTTAQVSAALKRGRPPRHRRQDRGDPGRTAQPQLAQPPGITAAYAAAVRSLAAVIATLNEQITVMEGQVAAHFSQHPDAEIILSQPGLGIILGARVLAEFGDDAHRYATAKARKNCEDHGVPSQMVA